MVASIDDTSSLKDIVPVGACLVSVNSMSTLQMQLSSVQAVMMSCAQNDRTLKFGVNEAKVSPLKQGEAMVALRGHVDAVPRSRGPPMSAERALGAVSLL